MLNKPVPAFSAVATGAESVASSALKGKNVVLYFYPKDSTPGCTTEAQQFRDLHADFLAANTVIYGISRDSLKSHENFKTKQALPFALMWMWMEPIHARAVDHLKIIFKTRTGRNGIARMPVHLFGN